MIGADLGPFETPCLGTFEPSILILDFLLASASGGMTTVCFCCKVSSQPALPKFSVDPLRPISRYPAFRYHCSPLALLAIGLRGCVIRAARIHLCRLTPDLCCACLTER